MTFVIMLGGIDLSVQSVASFSSVLVATLLPVLGPAAFPASILAGLLAGLASGFVHVRLRIPSFVATLGHRRRDERPRAARLARPDRDDTGTRPGAGGMDHGDGAGAVPNVIAIGAVVALAGLVVQNYTRFGRYSMAIGAGEPAALAAGISVGANKILAFGLSGALAALAGVMLAARLSSGSPNLANQLLLPTIAAVVVGGTAITGGVGGIGRTVVGALIVTTVQIGMTFLGVNIFAQQIVFGAALILAVSVTVDRGKMPIVK